ncbi:hypothetical protein [uncultured Pseudacidovorax sp.]|nr:hypothetical protein [uncultured Pseudacidovorax sp.]
MPITQVADRAQCIGANKGSTDGIEWSDYWPENARVPRIDPRKEPSNAQ